MLEESYTYDIQTNRKCSTIPPHVRLVCQKARLLIRPCLVSRKGQRQRTAGVTWSPPLGQWKKKNIQQHMICVSEDVYIGCTFYTLDKDKVHKIVCRFLAKLIKTSRSTEDIRKGNSWSPDRDFIKMANCHAAIWKMCEAARASHVVFEFRHWRSRFLVINHRRTPPSICYKATVGQQRYV